MAYAYNSFRVLRNCIRNKSGVLDTDDYLLTIKLCYADDVFGASGAFGASLGASSNAFGLNLDSSSGSSSISETKLEERLKNQINKPELMEYLTSFFRDYYDDKIDELSYDLRHSIVSSSYDFFHLLVLSSHNSDGKFAYNYDRDGDFISAVAAQLDDYESEQMAVIAKYEKERNIYTLALVLLSVVMCGIIVFIIFEVSVMIKKLPRYFYITYLTDELDVKTLYALIDQSNEQQIEQYIVKLNYLRSNKI